MTSRDAVEPPGDTRPSSTTIMVIAVFVGGVLGTAARMALGSLATAADQGTAAALATANPIDDVLVFTDPSLIMTLGVNLLGSLGLGVVVGAHWPARLDWLRAGLGTGALGAFTTFSFVMLAFAVLGLSSPWAWGLLLIGLVGGLLLAAVGHQIGAAIRPGRPPSAALPDSTSSPGPSPAPDGGRSS